MTDYTSPSTSSWSGQSSQPMTAGQFTQQTALGDLMQQRGLIIGAVVALVALWLFARSRQAPEEHAARRMVRDLRRADDADDARDVLGSNLPTIVRPALLIVLQEVERQIEHGFRRLEKRLSHM